MKSWLHNMIGKLWHSLGRLLVKTKHWDKTP